MSLVQLEKIVVSADQFSPSHVARIAAAVAGWGSCERVSQYSTSDAVCRALAEADIVVGWTSAAQLLASRASLYLCGSAGMDACLGAGLERKANFRACSAGSVMAVTIAEHVLALMLALARQIPQILQQQRERRWERRWQAGELCGSTACIVGLGGSGTELARRCRVLGLRTIGVRRDGGPAHPEVDRTFPVSRLSEAVREADHVVAVLPGGPHTRRLFDAAILDAMKPGACFYSAARGSVTDEAALVERLQSGRLGGAALDVFADEPLPAASPLWSLPNVIVSPHSAGLSARLSDRLCDLMCENLRRHRSGEPLRNEIDLATYTAPRPTAESPR